MDKKTILAIILITLVVTISMVIQGTMYSRETATANSTETEQTVNETTATTSASEAAKSMEFVVASTNQSAEKFFLETDLYRIEFDPVGASISSLILKEHFDADGEGVDLIFKGEDDSNAFLMYWGDDRSNPILDTFSYAVEGNKVVFMNNYTASSGENFTVVKTFEFKDGES